MNKNQPVLWFDPKDYLIKILNPKMLPYALLDNIIDSSKITTIAEGIKNYDKLRHFFANRVLSVSRDNAKQILESLQNKQHLTEEDSFQLSLQCRGVSTNDCFWIKEDDENISYDDINIRNRHLSDITFQISMQGTPASIEHSLLDADISTNGMFRKTWVRELDGLYLYKSDRTNEYVNTRAELQVSKYLQGSSVSYVPYEKVIREGILCCKCKCFTDDNISFVEADIIKDYCKRKGIDFLSYIKDHFSKDFANMVLCDYIFADPDEHSQNWGFLVDVDSNDIVGLAPQFDHNQALIIFITKTEKDFDELIYEPTGKTTLDSAIEWFPYTDLNFQNLPDFLQTRLNNIKERSLAIINSEDKDLKDEI
jgi:hypothetical protein